MKFEKVYCINPAKVGTGTFYNSFKKLKGYNEHTIRHSHSLDTLQNVLNETSNKLIIVGIRKGWDRYKSYFFQTYRDNFNNDFLTKKNNYEGECCLTEIGDGSNLKEILYNWKYKLTYFDWLEEFIEITGIKHFDKHNGFSLYKINGNTIVIYTFEHIEKVKNFFENMIGMKIENANITNNPLYEKVRDLPPDKEFIECQNKSKAYKIFYDI